MIKSNYYVLRFNKIRDSRYVFVSLFSVFLFLMFYKMTIHVKDLTSYSQVISIGFGIKFPIKISGVIIQNVYNFYLFLVAFGSLAFSNNIYQRFLLERYETERTLKHYDYKKLKYQYDPYKLQLILGEVHNQENLEYALKPYYQKIEGNGLFQNILITGTIGTGKTICAIVQLSLQLIYYMFDKPDKKCAMLFLDVKGNFYQFVHGFAKECGRWDDVITISLGGKYKYNPLHKPNLSPIELANRIRYVLELFSGKSSSEAYWVEKAEATICELIKLIRLYNNGYVNFEELHLMGTNDEYRERRIAEIGLRLQSDVSDSRQLDEQEKYEFMTALSYFRDEYLRLDEKAQGYIKSEITRMTGTFISSKMVKDTFCPSKEDITFSGFEDVIKQGKIVVWKINANKEPKVAKLIAAYLKLDMQKEVLITLENKVSSPIAAARTKVIICDEYQEYCTANDPDYMAQSREPRSITIAATQSYSSIKSALHNDDTKTNVLLQSFVNKIWLRSDDVDYTIKKVMEQASKVDKEKVTNSITEASRNSNVNYTLGKIVSKNKNVSSSQNTQTVKEYKFEVKFLSHDLKLGQAVCFLSNGESIIPPTVVHLTKMFEGRIICNDEKFRFTTNPEEIFKSINESIYEDCPTDIRENNDSKVTENSSDVINIPEITIHKEIEAPLVFVLGEYNDNNEINEEKTAEIFKDNNISQTKHFEEKAIVEEKEESSFLRDF